ncbi:MAG: hypothetical protein J6I49_03150 [Bacteroidales bacterium]|nr:hypothetical protein [Bacteroidales bacterium]
MCVGNITANPLGESPEVQRLACKGVWEEQLQAPAAARRGRRDARARGRAVDVEVDGVRQAATLGAPPDAQHTALIDSILRRLRCRIAPT